MRERLVRASLALALLAALAGCAAIPSSGDVVEFDSPQVDDRPNFDFLPNDPRPGAGPEEILRGFIDAATSPRGNYQVARKFLTPDFADDWQPQTGATIDLLSDREYQEIAGGTAWRVEAVPVAGLGPAGQYEIAESSTPIPLDYTFTEVDGEVRIASAPQGVLIDTTDFTSVYRQHTLYFFDPRFEYLVPDLRWFAGRDAVQTSIVRALVGGPSEWLSPAVTSAFPAGLGLELGVVPINGRVAEVDLVGTPVADAETLQRMQLQLSESLNSVQTISGVELSLNGVQSQETLPADPPTDVIRIDPRSLVFDDQQFGHLAADGGGVEPIEGISEQVVPLAPTAASGGVGFEPTAVRAQDGEVWVVRRGEAPLLADDRPRLVAPVVDVRGIVWTAVSDEPGTLRWLAPDGESGTIEAPWSAIGLGAFEISRDGTRMVALVASGARSRFLAVSIERDAEGKPRSLTGPLRLADLDGAALDAIWIDSRTVAALTRSADGGSTVTTLQVGGSSGERMGAAGPEGAVALDGGNSTSDLRVLVDDGTLVSRTGLGWQVRAEGVRMVGTQLQPE